MLAIGLSKGRAWEYERLPKHHPVYHCYYDFDTPPYGLDLHMYKLWMQGAASLCDPVAEYLEGIVLDGRLWILFSQKGYTLGIHDGAYHKNDITRMLQFCVNTLVFALTQEGSITNQVMDTVRY